LVALAGTSYSRQASAQVNLAISQNSGTVAAGNVVVYQITAWNAGPSASGSFDLYATIPNSTTVLQAQGGGAYCTGAWPCQPGQKLYWIPSIASGASETFEFSAQVNSGTSAPADGTTISTTASDSLAGSASVSEQTIVRTAGGLNVSLSCSPASVPPEGNIQCAVAYSNTGPAVTGAALSLGFPGALEVSAASGGGIVQSGGVTWNLGSLPAKAVGQEAVSLTVTSSVAPGTSAPLTALLQANAQISATSGLVASIGATDPLQVGIAATPDPVAPGQVVSYTITLSNTGATSLGSFDLYATVPNGTTVSQAQGGGAYCTGAWPCLPGEMLYWIPDIASGASQTFQFSALVDSGANAPSNGSLLVTDVTTTAYTGAAQGGAIVDGAAPSLVLSAPQQVAAGADYTYTLTYGNAGTATDSVELTVMVPAGEAFVAASSGGKFSDGFVTWKLKGLAPGEFSSQELAVQAPSTRGDVIGVDAEVANSSGSHGYSRGTLQTVIGSTDPMLIGVSATPNPVAPGQVVSYAITLSNTGATSLGSFDLYATVPNGTTVSQAQGGGAYCTGAWPCLPGEKIYWIPDIASGASQTFQYSALVDSGASAPSNGSLLVTDVTTTAYAGAAQGSAIVDGAAPSLVLSAPQQVAAGADYTYTLTYGNAGAATDDVELVMAVPTGTKFVSASSGVTPTKNYVTWDLGSLSPGAAGSQTITVKAPATAASVVTGEAQTLMTGSALSYGLSSVQTVIGSTDPILIGVSATPSPVAPGQVVSYVITLSNTGATSLGSFDLYATVPNGTTVSQAQGGGAYCTGAWPCLPGEKIYWIPDIASGASQTFQYSALVDSGASAPSNGSLLVTDVTTTAYAGAAQGSAIVDGAAPSLVLSAPQQVAAGADYTYTLTYGNAGAATDDVELVMAVPTGTKFVSASSGVTPTKNYVTWDLGSLSPGAAGSQTITVKAPATAASVVTGEAQTLMTGSALSYGLSSVQTVIGSTDPMLIEVSATANPVVAPGQAVTYTITLKNTGATSLGSFDLYATVPNGTTVSQAQGGGAYCTGAWPCLPGEKIYWIPDIASGASQTFQYSALVDSGASAPSNGSLLVTDVTTTAYAGAAQGIATVEN
jgi:uncharacterized repeat protein (TIGR01451 family)